MVNLNLNFPESFFHEEEICGFWVNKKRKEIWAVELDLLNELLKVCKKYDISIFASGGTLLGAARHKGFIPWDDDIDMMLSRSDYNRLCSIASDEFASPYFFQTEYTDPGSLRGHAQLRNSHTTGILIGEKDKKYSFNQGIFIDIFPLDNLPDSKCERKKYIKRCRYYLQSARQIKYGSIKRRNKIKQFIEKVSIKRMEHQGITSLELYEGFEIEANRYNHQTTAYSSLMCLKNGEERFSYENKELRKSVLMDFEIIKIPVPIEYKKLLKHVYGEWEKFVVGSSVHGEVIFDTTKSYNDYFHE